MKILICDDIRDDALLTKRIIEEQKLAEGAGITVFSPDELAKEVSGSKLDFDIAILDIEYHRDDLNGIELGKEINRSNPYISIIYLTEIPDYASDVYETMHCYFVIKKNQELTLSRAMNKAIRLYNSRNNSTLRIVEQWNTRDIPVNSIRYITRKGRKLCIVEDEQHEIYMTIRDMLSQLPPQFARCHSGFIVNLDYAESVNGANVTLKDGEKLPVGRQYKTDFYVSYAEYLGERT